MKAELTENGLYLFSLEVKSNKVTKKFKGLVDTGSNICACSYKIPVTLRARPTAFKPIQSPASEGLIHSLGYSLTIGFDGKSMMTHVFRLPIKNDEFDFILGLSILNYCKVTVQGKKMDINWIR